MAADGDCRKRIIDAEPSRCVHFHLQILITSDNPRFEKPQDIIDDIRTGIEKTDGKFIEICDRREAIAYVIHHGQPEDVIVLAGKGHEGYQEIEGIRSSSTRELSFTIHRISFIFDGSNTALFPTSIT
mgnify:CR=1 FL=1